MNIKTKLLNILYSPRQGTFLGVQGEFRSVVVGFTVSSARMTVPSVLASPLIEWTVLGVSPYNPRLIKRLRITYCLKAIDLFIPLHPFLQVIILCTYSVQHIIVGEGTEHSISANQCFVPIDRLVQHSVFGMMTYRESHCIVHLCFLQGKCKHLSAKGCDISRPKTRAKLFNSFLLQTVVLVSCQYGLL